MNKSEKKLPLFGNIAIYISLTFVLVLVDSIVLHFMSYLSLKEMFLSEIWIMNTSVFAYMSLLFIPLGVIIGLCDQFICNLIPGFKKSFSFFLSSILLCLFLIVLRSRIIGGSNLIKYSISIFILIISFSILLFIFSISLKKRYDLNKSNRLAKYFVLFIFLLITALFLLPRAYDYYLYHQFNYADNKSDFPNVIMIVMDTVRADSVSCYNTEKKTTPSIDKIAQEGTIFLRAISPAQWTVPSHASIFTGLYPSQHQAVWDFSYLEESFFTLAEYLKKLGYQTVGFTENPFVSKHRGFAQGFEDFYEIYSLTWKAIAPRVVDKFRNIFFNYGNTREYAETTVKYFKRWARENCSEKYSKPFFAFLNFMPAHLPNYPRSKFMYSRPSQEELDRIEPVNLRPERFYVPRYELSEKELKIMHSLYEGDVSYLDDKLGQLFVFLKDINILDNTILIITSDHGENFGDYGFIEHAFCLYNTLLHVPLIIRYPPKIASNTKRAEPVSTIFIFQTLIELIEDTDHKILENGERRSLLRSLDNKYIYAECDNMINMIKNAIRYDAPDDFDFQRFNKYLKCVFGESHKYIWSSDGMKELYNFKIDWSEKDNQILEEESLALDYFHELSAWQEKLWIPQNIKRPKKFDKEAEEVLKALGYIK